MINEAALLSPAYFIIPDVLPMKSESASTSCVHSGWVRTSASGNFFTFGKFCGTYAFVDRTESRIENEVFSGIWLCNISSEIFVRYKKNVLLWSALTTFTAFAEVTHTSEWLLKVQLSLYNRQRQCHHIFLLLFYVFNSCHMCHRTVSMTVGHKYCFSGFKSFALSPMNDIHRLKR